MRAHLFIQDGDQKKLLVEVDGVEVVPRGFYVVEGVVYQYTGQPTFIIEKIRSALGEHYYMTRVEITVEKQETK